MARSKQAITTTGFEEIAPGSGLVFKARSDRFDTSYGKERMRMWPL